MNKERIIWMLLLVLSVMYIDRKEAHIENLESLDRNNQLSHRLQSDQISEMLSDYDQLGRSEYGKGFQDGKTHALVSVMHEEEINSYADGYHAALSQLESQGLSKDLVEKVVKNLKND
jgi:hypothetical protein